jgi:hypothetical protein
MIAVACCLGILAVVIIMTMNGRGQVPWVSKMRRIHAGVARKAEWMAPDEVVNQVRADYLAATHWLQDTMLTAWAQQWSSASSYLSGVALKRFQAILTHHRTVGAPRCIGVLRADHEVAVRLFSEDGERCLVVDQQAQRRMATYDSRDHTRLFTQDLGDGAVVYQMVYDTIDRRWKIDEFVQELPLGWGKHKSTRKIRELSAMPTEIGRDN